MEEKEKIEIIGKSLLLIILTIVISVFAWFAYGVIKVNAQGQYRWLQQGNWNAWRNFSVPSSNTLSDVYFDTTNRSFLQIQDTTPMANNQGYDVYLKIELNVPTSGAYVNIGSTTDLYNGTTLVSMNNKCEKNYSVVNSTNNKKVLLTINCQNFSGNGYYPYISLQIQALNGQISNDITAKILSYDYKVNQGSQDANAIMNNDNKNFSSLMEANENNTQNIINNNNSLFQQQNQLFESFYNGTLESQKVCEVIDKEDIEIDNKWISATGEELNSNNFGITGYINIENAEIKVINGIQLANSSVAYCFYDENKIKINCINFQNIQDNTEITIPTNAKYLRTSIYKSQNKPTFQICKNGNQALMDGPGWTNENPDSTAEDDLEDSEEELMDYLVDPDELEDLDLEIDTTTNGVIWGIFDDIITGNEIYFTSFISILFLGLVKLILAR